METILIVLVGVIMAILLVGIALLFYDEAGRGRQVRAQPAMGLGQTFPSWAPRSPPEAKSAVYSPASLTVKPLPSVEAARFSGDWRRIRDRFKDDPGAAVADADRLAKDLMEARGYLEREPPSVSRGDSVLIESYRRAHRIAQANDGGQAGAAELRQAIVYYRSLFEELLETEEAVLMRS
ncbi:MAG: hypothetical protein E6J43_10900 [Chloroflexi bacterium]|nr:MAG: hypothetical protein E6J43_10900 [Chloroflexota bacterium]